MANSQAQELDEPATAAPDLDSESSGAIDFDAASFDQDQAVPLFMRLLRNPSSIVEESARAWTNPRMPEFLEMLLTLLKGQSMGPGDGWYHDGQTRFGWNWLAARHDLNQDGSITREEFLTTPELFDLLDRNLDDLLEPSDLNWADGAARQADSLTSLWFTPMDGNSNGRISREEWDQLYTRLTAGKDYLSPLDLKRFLQKPPPPAPRPQQVPAEGEDSSRRGPSMLTLFKALFEGEIGSWQEGPGIGDDAPDFELEMERGEDRVRLSDFRGKKPVVLIFGSFT